MKLLGIAPGRQMTTTTPMRIEPKTFFANERTFLAWLHMAVTLGSISAALLGFASGWCTVGVHACRPCCLDLCMLSDSPTTDFLSYGSSFWHNLISTAGGKGWG